MKKTMKKTVCPHFARAVKEALEYEPPADIGRLIPPDFIEKVMVEIRKIGPLKKTSGSVPPSDTKSGANE